MNDFQGLLPPDYGFKPQGKSAPMAGSKPSPANPRSSSARASAGSYRVDSDSIFSAKSNQKSQASFDEFGDIFRKPEARRGGNSSIDVDSMFDSGSKSSSSLPIYDKPVYDDDIFNGVPGLKTSNSVKHDEVFASNKVSGSGRFDDLLSGIGKKENSSKSKGSKNLDFDDLLPGFRGGSPSQRQTKESEWSSRTTTNSNKKMNDPFAGIGSTSPHVTSSSGLGTDPLEEISKLGHSGSVKSNGQSARNKESYNDMDPFDSFRKSMPSLSTEKTNRAKDGSPLRTDSSTGDSNRFSIRSSGTHSRGATPADKVHESQKTFFDMPAFSNITRQSTGQNASSSSYENGNSTEANIQADDVESSDEVWLTVSEIPLFTQPTSAPPPSRPPPPRPVQASKAESGSFGSRNGQFSSSVPPFTGSKPIHPVRSTVDEIEDFAKGRSRSNNFDDLGDGPSNDKLDTNSDAAASAAAMKEAMERAEAKFRHAKEMRERENSRAARSRESVQLEKDERAEDVFREKQERLERQLLQREKEEEEREQRRLEIEREREEKEREQKRLERARQAVERATREARERTAAEARLKAERAAIEKAQTEARERAERTAVQRAQAEVRERAANEAKERAERAAAEARDRETREKAAEARMRAERAAVERAAAEARERAAKEAREKAAAASAASAARASQQKNANDLDSFFNMGSHPQRPGPSASDPAFDAQFHSRQGPAAARTSATTQASNIKKAASTANIVDDLSSIFGAAASSGEQFQEVEGETEERRRARLERHQRTKERAAKALAEKNQRDLRTQREQEEKHRIAETLDNEIKRWAAGKEGNLRALLSTLQYVLWPECGWQPISLTDLITGAAVKKVYRKATLCVHPDKVQQKGANLQQKYVAEKVFDLLKEAWNKFNSEELF